MPWQPGESVVRREVWHGKPRAAVVVVVAANLPDLLTTYLPEVAQEGWWGDWTAWEPDPRWAPTAPTSNWLEAAELGSSDV